MQFTAILEKFDSQLWGFHVKVPTAISEVFIAEGNKRVVCTLNGTEEIQCALMPNGDGVYFVMLNKKTRDKLGLKLGAAVEVNLRKDESEYGLPMPEEFKELLAQDEEGNRLFHVLTPGKQRNLLYIAGNAKTSDVRLKRAVVLVEHLKKNEGKINFKQLNEDLKEANRM